MFRLLEYYGRWQGFKSRTQQLPAWARFMLVIAAIPGVLLSSGLTVKLPDRILRLALAITLLASGVKLIDIPHGNAIALGVLGAGLLALAVAGFSRLAAAAREPEAEQL